MFGVAAGMVLGCIPGLNANVGIVLLLPFTFYLGPVPGIAMLMGMSKGDGFGGSIPSILFNIPGTAHAVVTTLDGYPLTKKGQGGKALETALAASCTADFTSDLILIFLAAPVAAMALHVGPPEYTMIVLFSVVLIALAASDDPLRGLGLQEHVAFSTGRPEDEHLSWKEYKSLLPTIFRSTGIGSLIGILPGIGTSVASYLSYVVAKRRSKHPEKFGTGVLEGVASCEAGNNAVNGPNLIPLVTLGIPGNLAAALILGGLMVKGLTPGPTFMENQAPMLYALFTVMLFSNIFTLLFGKLAIRYAHKMTSISPSALHGNILILCAMGCYVSQNSAFALLIMFTFAVVGYIFLRLKLSLPVFLVAYILGSMLEHKLRQSLALSDGDFTIFLTRPISATFLALTVICTLYFLFRKKSASGKAS